nr:carbohydrate porin [Gilliamella apicola]
MKLRIIAGVCCLYSVSALASIEWQTEQGKLKLYGDVEFNIDAASKKHQLTSVRTSAKKDFDANDSDRWDINGRILIGLDGIRELDNQSYAGFSVQPLADLSGKVNLDDADFYFGQQNDWRIKIGRYEAYDMFPLGQDTFIEYSGNTANDLYSDGFGYIYMMKEGRGRSSSGGAIELTKYVGNFDFQVNAMIKDGTTLFDDNTYHGYKLHKDKNVIYLRPVISYKNNYISSAIAIEHNVVNNAYRYYNDSKGKWLDQSKRTGYGLTMSWNSEGDFSKSSEGILVNTSFAYLDAEQEKDFTAGVNGVWNGIGLGYIFAANDIKAFNPSYKGDGEIYAKGKYKLHTINASYLIADVMGMDNFNIYLGSYWSQLDRDKKQGGGDDNRYGARVRFKYFF